MVLRVIWRVSGSSGRGCWDSIARCCIRRVSYPALISMEAEDARNGTDDWSSHLPSFANKANQELDAYIKRVRQELEYTDVSWEDNEDRIKVMSEHLANVQAELKYTQSRFNAKTNEIRTEDHLKQLSKRQGVSAVLTSASRTSRAACCHICLPGKTRVGVAPD